MHLFIPATITLKTESVTIETSRLEKQDAFQRVCVYLVVLVLNILSRILPVRKIGTEMKNPPIAQTRETDEDLRYLAILKHNENLTYQMKNYTLY